MVKGVGHIGIIVKSIDDSVAALSKFMDIEKPVIQKSEKTGMQAGVIDLGGFKLELIQDLQDDGPLAKTVAEKGDMIHHFCLLTDDIDEDVARLKEKGVSMVDAIPRTGIRGKRIAMCHPDAFNGVTIELSEA